MLRPLGWFGSNMAMNDSGSVIWMRGTADGPAFFPRSHVPAAEYYDCEVVLSHPQVVSNNTDEG